MRHTNIVIFVTLLYFNHGITFKKSTGDGAAHDH